MAFDGVRRCHRRLEGEWNIYLMKHAEYNSLDDLNRTKGICQFKSMGRDRAPGDAVIYHTRYGKNSDYRIGGDVLGGWNRVRAEMAGFPCKAEKPQIPRRW